MSVADSYAAFQEAQRAYYKAADLIERSLPSDLARSAFSAAGKALTAARHAAHATREITQARSTFPPRVVDAVLKAAGEAAAFAAQASRDASAIACALVGAPLAIAGQRTREESARIEVAIDESVRLQEETTP